VRLWARGDLRIPSGAEPEPDQQLNDAFAKFGLVLEGDLVLEEECFLWPDNVQAFNLWMSVQTQWHWTSIPGGIGGGRAVRTGLNYPGVETCIKHRPIPKKERAWYFTAVQEMEQAALEEWNTER
jgi:hypothetical protein